MLPNLGCGSREPLVAVILPHCLNERDISGRLGDSQDSPILTNDHHSAAKSWVWLINVGHESILRVCVSLGNLLDADAHPIN
jgi:hypothetical protein